jgi:hypothetical protein
MLKSREPFDGALSCIATSDIETDSEGNLLDVNFVYRDESGVNHYATFETWEDYLIHVGQVCNKVKIDRVYAHNGGGFDWVELCRKLLSDAPGNTLGTIAQYKGALLSNSKIMQLSVKIRRCKRVVRFADSFYLLSTSLDALTGPNGFNLDLPKIKIPKEYMSDMGRFKQDHPDLYHAYHKRDSESLLEVLHRFRDGINSVANIGNLTLSIASTAMRVYQTRFLHWDIVTPGAEELDFTFQGYQGGRTEFVGDGGPDSGTQATYSGVHQWDSNSHYPAQMRLQLFPVVSGTKVQTRQVMYQGGLLRPGMYRATYEQKHGRMAIIKPRLPNGHVSKDACWVGEAVATHLEWNEIIKHGGTVKPSVGYVYTNETMQPIFKDFVDTLYALRMSYKDSGNLAMVLIIKLLMNNLYGKFGEKPVGDRLALMDDAEVITLMHQGQEDGITKVTHCPDVAENCYIITEPRKVRHTFPSIAAFITAGGRLALLEVANTYGVEVVYMDTDSIHTRGEFPASLTSETELGKFKCESLNHPDGVVEVIAARKAYINVTEQKTKCKGIPTKAFEDYKLPDVIKAIETGQPMLIAYKAPTKIKTAVKLQGVSANKFLEHTRTINRDQSTYQKGLLR